MVRQKCSGIRRSYLVTKSALSVSGITIYLILAQHAKSHQIPLQSSI